MILVLEVKEQSLAGKVNRANKVSVGTTKNTEFEVEEGKEYLISSVDSYSLQSPPAGNSYEGNTLIYSHRENLDCNKANTLTTWSGLNTSDAFDGDESTFTPIGNTEQFVTWEGNLVNNVVTIKMRSHAWNTRDITMRVYDKDGNVIEFIDADTDKTYLYWRTASGSIQTKNIIIPEEAHKIGFIHTADFGGVHIIQKNKKSLNDILCFT